MSRSSLLVAASLVVAAALPAAVAGAAEAAKPKPKPKLAAIAPTVAESAGTAVMTVRLAGKAKKAVKVGWRTADGTAKAGSDYTASKGTATIRKGRTSATISVPVVSDGTHEDTEQFVVVLTSRQADVRTRRVNVTITDSPSRLVGTITMTRRAFDWGMPAFTLKMHVHLVPTGVAGEWRDDGAGMWSITGRRSGGAATDLTCPQPSRTISGSGAFLTGAGTPTAQQAVLTLRDFDPTAGSGTPSMSWQVLATETDITWSSLDSHACAADLQTSELSVSVPRVSGSYTGTAADRGLQFTESSEVTGSFTPMG